MTRSACFVPGCYTGYPKDRMEKKMQGIRTPSLFKPRNLEELRQWRKYIPRADRVLRMRDCVCELHFLKEDVVKYFETKITDGTLFRLERGRYKLAADAVPLIFPCLPNYLSEVRERRRRMRQQCDMNSDKIVIQKTRNCPASPENFAVDVKEPVESFSIDENLKVDHKAENSFDTAKTFELDVSEPTETFTYADTVETYEQDVSEPTETFTYAELTDNIDYIVRPNILWGITCHELFVMCALWNVEGELQLNMMIDKSMDVKISRNGETIVLKNQLTCIEDVSALLSKINGDIIDPAS